jgi:hypothetical protein
VAQGRLWNPRRAGRGSLSAGFGVQSPAGKDNVLTTATATTPSVVTADYSIQPGSGVGHDSSAAGLRGRTRGVPDKILGTHGHAAFADYVWLRSYTYRLPAKGHTEK